MTAAPREVVSNSSADEATRGVIVLGDRLALRRIVANIIDNAIKYGRVARLRLQLENPAIVLTVDDEGPGIPADRRQAMLEPFNRLETSRNRATGGAGLGLAVVRSLVEAHDGTIGSDGGAGRRHARAHRIAGVPSRRLTMGCWSQTLNPSGTRSTPSIPSSAP